MFAMFKQAFLALTALCAGLELYASAFKRTGEWADEQAATFVDEARIERAKKMATMKQELKAVEDKASRSRAA